MYWVFDGSHDAIVRYDFQDDHDIGEDDHSDGIVYRLTEPSVTRVENAPGHMMIDPATDLLYVADSGGGRILRVDTQSGEVGDALRQRVEVIEEYAEWNGVDWAEIVTGLETLCYARCLLDKEVGTGNGSTFGICTFGMYKLIWDLGAAGS